MDTPDAHGMELLAHSASPLCPARRPTLSDPSVPVRLRYLTPSNPHATPPSAQASRPGEEGPLVAILRARLGSVDIAAVLAAVSLGHRQALGRARQHGVHGAELRLPAVGGDGEARLLLGTGQGESARGLQRFEAKGAHGAI